VKKPVVNKIYVDLPSKARTIYKKMEKEMFVQLAKHEVEAFNAASMTIKCQQIANGALYVGDSNDQFETIHDSKLEALESVIEEAAGAPVLVAYHFRSDLARLRRAFPKGSVFDADSRTLALWNAGKIPLMFLHPASAGHGLSLQDGGNILAFFGLNWNLEEHMQAIERIGPVRQMQSGHNRPVFVHYIMAKNTIDELILERLETKRDVQDILLEAMKQKT
jgi:SNF2 family DNA or RNA helicase